MLKTPKDVEARQVAIGILPNALPDELLYSLLARTISQNAMQSPRHCMEFFFGSRNVIPSVDLPTNLTMVQRRFGVLSPFRDIHQLIDLATLYPYFRPFLPPERHARCMNIMRDGGGHALKALMGTVANGFGAGPVLRYCALCQRAGFERHGALFWHRTHNLPGVACCSVHKINLEEHPLHRNAVQRQVLLLPPFACQQREKVRSHNDHALAFARLSADLLAANLAPIQPELRCAIYRDAVRKSGFGEKNGRLEHVDLANEVRLHYNDFAGFIHAQRLLSSAKTPSRWIHDCIERPNRAMHPICHLILIGFLFGGVDAFNAAVCESNSKNEYKTNSCEPKNRSNEDADQLSKSGLYDCSTSCRTVAVALGLSVTTVVNLRRRHGIPISERRKKLQPALVEKITKDLRLGKGIIPIAKKYLISVGSVYRILQQQPETKKSHQRSQKEQERPKYRKEWARNLKIHGAKGVKAARAVAASTYAWLYRNDRQWLGDQNSRFRLAKKKGNTRIDWSQRDALLVTKAIQLIDTLKENTSRPRISKTLILRTLGCGDLVQAYPEKLPRLLNMLSGSAESIVEYQKVRIERTIDKLQISSSSPLMWKISREAGIKVLSNELRAHAMEYLDAMALNENSARSMVKCQAKTPK